MRFKKLSYRMMSLLVAGVVMSFSFSSLAQFSESNCGQLSRQECRRVGDSLDITRDLTAAAFHSDIVLTIRDNFSRAYTTTRVLVDGAYRLNDNRTSTDPLIAIRGLDADISVLVDISDLANISGDVIPPEYEEVGFDLALMDGVGYINLSKLIDEADRDADWYGMDLGALLQFALNSAGTDLPTDNLLPQDTGIVTSAPHLPFGLPATDVQRMSDLTFNDVEMERYLWIVDFDTVIADGSGQLTYNIFMLSLLDTYLQGQNYSADELLDIIDSYATLAEALSLRVERLIDPADGYIYRTTYSLAYQPTDDMIYDLYRSPDPLGLASINSDIYLDVTIERSHLNEDFILIAPDNAILLTLFDLLPLLEDANL